MFKTPLPPPPFPVLESFVAGLRLMGAHARLIGVLSFFPFVVTLATMVAIRLLGESITLFWLPVVQFPASFVTGLECALILRFIVLHESPLLSETEARSARNRAVAQSAFIYAAITYFVTGAYAALLMGRQYITKNPEAAAPYAPLLMALLILLMWGARWFWLHVPRALDWQSAGFYQRVGKWPGSLRVFALFALCSLLMNFAVSFVRLGIAAIGGNPPKGFAAAFDDAAIAAATLALAVLFTTATAAAVKLMLGKGQKP